MTHFAKYEHGYSIVTKDGHTMMLPDIVRDLNRKSYLERENGRLYNALRGLSEVYGSADFGDGVAALITARQLIAEIDHK